MNGSGGCKEGKRTCDHFVTGLNPGGEKSQDQRIGAGCAADGILRIAIGRNFLLEGRNFVAQNECLTFKAAIDRLFDLITNRLILSHKVYKRDRLSFRRGGSRVTEGHERLHSLLVACCSEPS